MMCFFLAILFFCYLLFVTYLLTYLLTYLPAYLVFTMYMTRSGDELDRRTRVLFSRVCTQRGRAKRASGGVETARESQAAFRYVTNEIAIFYSIYVRFMIRISSHGDSINHAYENGCVRPRRKETGLYLLTCLLANQK